jgi:hypothetical protein
MNRTKGKPYEAQTCRLDGVSLSCSGRFSKTFSKSFYMFRGGAGATRGIMVIGARTSSRP